MTSVIAQLRDIISDECIYPDDKDEKHPVFEYKFTDKRSDNPVPYELEMFIR